MYLNYDELPTDPVHGGKTFVAGLDYTSQDFAKIKSEWYNVGYDTGLEDGSNQGYEDGYKEGYLDGMKNANQLISLSVKHLSEDTN